MQSGYADINGIKMYYEVRGSGDPIVLIHGAGSTIYTTFGRIIDDLAKNRKIIGVELQAHGHTSDRNAPLSFEQDADDVAALMSNLNVEKADIFGFSNGGNTALHIAIRHPEKVNKVIAASPLLKRDGAFPQFFEFMNNAKLEHMPAEYKTEYLKITGDSARLQNMHDKCAERMVSFKDMTDEELTSIKAPVLLVSGYADVATAEHIVAMSRIIPGCTVAIFPGGHGEFLGEITTLKKDQSVQSGNEFPIMPVLKKFLN